MQNMFNVEGGTIEAAKDEAGNTKYCATSIHKGYKGAYWSFGGAAHVLWAINERVEGAAKRKGLRHA